MKTRSERWEEIDASVRAMFRTISSEDWAREIRRARATRNAISDRIRARILAGVSTAQPAAEVTSNIKSKGEET
jgi:hypothetical protein